MKELLLIRHGKSDWNDPAPTDHDRPLNARGRRDAPRIAEALAERKVSPGLVVASTAVRAADTARRVAESLGFAPSGIVHLPELYLASPRTILRVVQNLDESASTALVFGHNPGMHEAANLFAGDAEIEEFPTLAVARIRLSSDHWGSADWGDGTLLELILPRKLPDGPGGE